MVWFAGSATLAEGEGVDTLYTWLGDSASNRVRFALKVQ